MFRAKDAPATLAPQLTVALIRILPHPAALTDADGRQQAVAMKEASRAPFDEVRIDQI